jgi:hypothetical protein
LFHGEAWLLFLRIVRIQSPGAKILKVKAHQVENLNWYVELYRTSVIELFNKTSRWIQFRLILV